MSRTVLLGLALLVPASLWLVGCGPNCQSTCNRLYSDGNGDCGIVRPAPSTTDKLLDYCNDQCEAALNQPGELGSYNPDERQGSSDPITLDNEKMAAVWMDCIAETSCEDLGSGYCAPVW